MVQALLLVFQLMILDFIATLYSDSVLGYAASAAVVCSQYAKDVGGDGGLDSYYKRPIPGHCRAARLGNYRPTYRIKEPWSNCKGGFRKYKNACYRLARGNHDGNFRDIETICNKHQGHVVTWKNRQEFMWIHNNIANQNKWYWVGIFCGQGTDITRAYTSSGEDMRIIGPKWGFKGAHPLNMGSHPCWMWHRNNASWMKQFHYQGCHEGRGGICKSPLA